MSIQSEIDRLKNIKIAIKDAIVESGIDVPDSTPFTEYANKTSQIIGQFDTKLDEIIGGEIVPMLDVQQRLETISGIPGDVSTQLDTLDAIKAGIADAITTTGVNIPEGTPFSEYINKIEDIPYSTVEYAEVTITTTGNLVRGATLNYVEDQTLQTATIGKNDTQIFNIPIYQVIYLEGNSIFANGYSWKYDITGDADGFFIMGNCQIVISYTND